MKIRNLLDYRDKETREMQKKGAVREVTPKRRRELIKLNLAEEVADEPAREHPAPPKTEKEETPSE